MSIELLTLLFFFALFVFLVLGLPLSFVLGGVSVIFIYFKIKYLLRLRNKTKSCTYVNR